MFSVLINQFLRMKMSLKSEHFVHKVFTHDQTLCFVSLHSMNKEGELSCGVNRISLNNLSEKLVDTYFSFWCGGDSSGTGAPVLRYDFCKHTSSTLSVLSFTSNIRVNKKSLFNMHHLTAGLCTV